VDHLDDVAAALLGERRDFSRTTVPSLLGIRPMSLFWIARSMAPSALRSHGWMTSVCASGR
jgi:hypothetical protein